MRFEAIGIRVPVKIKKGSEFIGSEYTRKEK